MKQGKLFKIVLVLIALFCVGTANAQTDREEQAKNQFQEYRQLAEDGDPVAQYNLAMCFKNGDGVEQNIPEADKWLRRAAEQGNEEALIQLRELHEENGIIDPREGRDEMHIRDKEGKREQK